MIRLVIADDHLIIRQGLRLILETEADFELAGEAADGAEALQLCAQLRPDVVLMDLRMPGMSGVDAARALRAKGVTAPIAALTADAFDEDRRACLAAGMDDFLVKPLTQEALRDTLTRWTTTGVSRGWTKTATRAKVAS